MKLTWVIVVLVSLLAVGVAVAASLKTPLLKSSSSGTDYLLTGSSYKDNYVFGGAMQLAVNDLNDKILHGKLQLVLSPADSETKKDLDIFNQAQFTVADLDSSSYYVKSGYGQNTVSEINRESRAKFPSKSFSDLSVTLEPRDFIAYAYFLKQIEYGTAFDRGQVQFLGQPVLGFQAGSSGQRDNVRIVNYQDDDRFIVKLNLKDNSDEIYLAKGYDMADPKTALSTINGHSRTVTMGEDDVFQAPEVHLNMSRDYSRFIGKYLTNPGFQGYSIKVMTEDIKFDMDNKGARVENQAWIVGHITGLGGNQPKHKELILDKPYWIIMKRASSSKPYFVLGVNNVNILSQ